MCRARVFVPLLPGALTLTGYACTTRPPSFAGWKFSPPPSRIVLCSTRAASLTGVAPAPVGSIESGLISCEKLKEELAKGSNVRVVDATWYLKNSPFAGPEGSPGPEADFRTMPRIPKASFFDVDGCSAVSPDGLPHMMPDEDTFSDAMRSLGIDHQTPVVFYDQHGIFSAPRAWYTLKVTFSHPAPVAVLDGGLPQWKALGYELEEGPPQAPLPAKQADKWVKDEQRVWDWQRVKGNIDSKEALHVDVRSAGRFEGTAPEPRPGSRGGKIPGSLNLPFPDLLTGKPAVFRPVSELRGRMKTAGIHVEQQRSALPPITASCGSGMTACILCLALHLCGVPSSRVQLYDGSWAEWGSRRDTPIVRKGAEGKEEPVP